MGVDLKLWMKVCAEIGFKLGIRKASLFRVCMYMSLCEEGAGGGCKRM